MLWLLSAVAIAVKTIEVLLLPLLPPGEPARSATTTTVVVRCEVARQPGMAGPVPTDTAGDAVVCIDVEEERPAVALAPAP